MKIENSHRFSWKWIIVFLFVIVSTILFLNTLAVSQMKYPWDNVSIQDDWIIDNGRRFERAQRLAKALTIPTISWGLNQQEYEELLKFHQYLQESFPLIHSSPFIRLTVVNNYSLLYKVQGSETTDVLPYMLAAHLDVVPVNGSWIADPFEGKIVDDVIYGRGALDDKSSVLGILEAVEYLLERGYSFKRTFFIAFGHDEELSGHQGAAKIAETLQQNGVPELDFILDEGYYVMERFVKGVNELVGIIGVTEKGYSTIELSVNMTPGHSSIPPKETSIGTLARAVGRLEERPHPSLFGYGPEEDFFYYLAPYASIGYRLVFSNLWLFSPLMKYILSLDNASDAIQRTTTAVTVINGGYKSNVIPGHAYAIVNHRIHPADSLSKLIERNRVAIGDPRVEVKVKSYYPSTPISPYGRDVPQFRLIAQSIKEIYPTSVIAPACSPANTDLRRYVTLTSKLYRINPTIVTPVTRTGIHGDNERITVDEYQNFIAFYVRLLVNADRSLEKERSTLRSREL